MTIEEELEAIEAARSQALEALGDRVLEEYVKPACDKYNCDFTSGMGTYFFSSKNFSTVPMRGWSFSSIEDIPKRYPLIEEAFEVLDIPVDQMSSVGSYVPDYKSSTKKAKLLR